MSQAVAVVQASGNVQVGEKLQEFLAAVARGEGGAAFLELAAMVQASGDPALEALLVEFVDSASEGEELPDGLLEEFIDLIHSSGNEEVHELFHAGFEAASEEAPLAERLLEFGALIQASDDLPLRAKWIEIIEADLASAGPPPQEALDQAVAREKPLTVLRYE